MKRTLLPSGALFSFFGGRVPLSNQSTKTACPFFPWPLGIYAHVLTSRFSGGHQTCSALFPSGSIHDKGSVLVSAAFIMSFQSFAKSCVCFPEFELVSTPSAGLLGSIPTVSWQPKLPLNGILTQGNAFRTDPPQRKGSPGPKRPPRRTPWSVGRSSTLDPFAAAWCRGVAASRWAGTRAVRRGDVRDLLGDVRQSFLTFLTKLESHIYEYRYSTMPNRFYFGNSSRLFWEEAPLNRAVCSIPMSMRLIHKPGNSHGAVVRRDTWNLVFGWNKDKHYQGV